MDNRSVLIIDETLREGMQYKGVMFSYEQRLEILKFQEKLKIDLCQAGYPPAHDLEAGIIKKLNRHAVTQQYNIKVAAMGRAVTHDADILLATGIRDFHFHIFIDPCISAKNLGVRLSELRDAIGHVKDRRTDAVVSVAMLDIGRSETGLLRKCIEFLNHSRLDIISLPDTSGMMAPNQVFEKIGQCVSATNRTKVSIHCHNDLGMATANSIMGIVAGGHVLEASALGVGERNGIADLYTTACALKAQGFKINAAIDDIDTFIAYYTYVDTIVHEQTGEHLLTATTPVFGDAVKTHVAGTHADGRFGLSKETSYFLNLLCGKQLVKKYLDAHDVYCPDDLLSDLTLKIKEKSLQLNRRLDMKDILPLITALK